MRKNLLAATAVGAALALGGAGLTGAILAGPAGAATVAPGATTSPSTGSPSTGAPSTGAKAAHHPRLRRLLHHELVVAAGLIGVTPAQLRTDLKAGQTVDQVAQSKGVATDTVVNGLVKDATTRINAAVAKGRLTQARATTLEGRLPALVQKLVTTDLAARHQAPASS
jgi:hypothetical protein